jgi:hypothetical protein
MCAFLTAGRNEKGKHELGGVIQRPPLQGLALKEDNLLLEAKASVTL